MGNDMGEAPAQTREALEGLTTLTNRRFSLQERSALGNAQRGINHADNY